MNRDVLPKLQLFIHAMKIAAFTDNRRDQQEKITPAGFPHKTLNWFLGRYDPRKVCQHWAWSIVMGCLLVHLHDVVDELRNGGTFVSAPTSLVICLAS